MASWNELAEGDILEPCPVCQVRVAKKRRTKHLIECCERYEDYMTDVGLIKCPLYSLHVLPKTYLNHHLDGNCEEAQNMLRKYFQVDEVEHKAKEVPKNFLEDVPDDVLNKQSKQLLYFVKRDLNGKDISEDKNFYPDD